MKKIAFGLALIAGSMVAGCASQTLDTAQPSTTPTAPQTTNPKPNHSQTFLCKNGIQVVVKHLNDEQISLSSDNVSATLRLAPSASGERYVSNVGLWGNQGGEWHQAGNTAHFSYKGVHDSKERQTTCQAQ